MFNTGLHGRFLQALVAPKGSLQVFTRALQMGGTGSNRGSGHLKIAGVSQ